MADHHFDENEAMWKLIETEDPSFFGSQPPVFSPVKSTLDDSDDDEADYNYDSDPTSPIDTSLFDEYLTVRTATNIDNLPSASHQNTEQLRLSALITSYRLTRDQSMPNPTMRANPTATPRHTNMPPPRSVNNTPRVPRRSPRVASAVPSPATTSSSRRDLMYTPLRQSEQGHLAVAPATPAVPSPFIQDSDKVQSNDSLAVPGSSNDSQRTDPNLAQKHQHASSQAVPSPYDVESKIPMESPTKSENDNVRKGARRRLDLTNTDVKRARIGH